MKKLLPGILSLCALFVFGWFLYNRLASTPMSTTESSSTVAPLPPSVKESPENAEQLPPAADGEGNFSYVNQRRLFSLAGKPYKGMKYKEDYSGLERMVAEKAKLKDRLPANETETQDKKSK